jgi:hypothetical protein
MPGYVIRAFFDRQDVVVRTTPYEPSRADIRFPPAPTSTDVKA